jgi:hypothetical protein
MELVASNCSKLRNEDLRKALAFAEHDTLGIHGSDFYA